MEDVSWSILFALPRPVLNFSYWRDAFCKGGNEPHSEMEIRFHLDLAKKKYIFWFGDIREMHAWWQ